ERITGAGLALIIVSAVIGIAGISLWHFWIALALLGVGWNFAFIGATTMVTHCHRPSERNKVQAFNDFLVFGSMAIGSFSSGTLFVSFGWSVGTGSVFPVGRGELALLVGGAWGGRSKGAGCRGGGYHPTEDRWPDSLVLTSMPVTEVAMRSMPAVPTSR